MLGKTPYEQSAGDLRDALCSGQKVYLQEKVNNGNNSNYQTLNFIKISIFHTDPISFTATIQ
jgi:hypothetical protein